MFYRCLHFLVTLIFSLSVSVRYYFKLTRRKALEVFYKEAEADIEISVATLKNLPRHISFIVLEEDIDFSVLARLVLWSIAAGISYLSVYDPWGILKERKEEFYNEVCQMRHLVHAGDYDLQLKENHSLEQNGVVNGTAHKFVKKVFLNVLSKEDGKEDIVKAAKMFCNGVRCKEFQSKIMNVQYFSTLLEGNKCFPDPDLAIKFGSSYSLQEYPPWQIRLTEFISVSSLKVVDHKLFLRTLHEFSKCEQRLGR